MASRRVNRVEGQVMAEISKLLLVKANDPRLKSVNLTEVKASPDLKRATVYFGIFGDAAGRQEAEAALKGSAGFFRRELGKALELKFVPEIIFRWDESLEHSQHMDEVFKQIERDDKL